MTATTHRVVVALGQVDPDLVRDQLPDDAVFVPDPGPHDFAHAEGAIVRADVDVDRAMLAAMPGLRVIARTGVGVDRVDLAAATARRIPVVITPGSGTHAVAEGTLAMILHLVKRLSAASSCVAEGRWAERGALAMGDLDGATIGIVGYGRIGRRVAHLARAFGMTVVAYDPYAGQDPDLVDLAELRRRSHVLSLHLPLDASTRHLVDAAFLDELQHGAVLVNCGRGGLVDLDAAAASLEHGRLGGLGLDVFEHEPPTHHRVFDRDDVVLSPHLMGLTRGATTATFQAAARGVADVFAGRPPEAVANPDWARASTVPDLTDQQETS